MDQTTLEARSGSVTGNPGHRLFGSSQKPIYLTFGSAPTLKRAVEVIMSLSQLMGPISSQVVDCAVINIKAALPKHLFQVSIAQRVAQIPGHGLHDQPCLEMPPFEIVLRLALQLLGNGIQNHFALHDIVSGNFLVDGQQLVYHKNLRQAPPDSDQSRIRDFKIDLAHHLCA